MKTVKFNVTYKEKASRLELFVRIAWAIPTAIVMAVLMIIAVFASLGQILHILILGKRHKCMHEWIYKFMAYYVDYGCYKALLTDERNPIMPEG